MYVKKYQCWAGCRFLDPNDPREMRIASEKLMKSQLVHVELRNLCFEQLGTVLAHVYVSNQRRIWDEIIDSSRIVIAPLTTGCHSKPIIPADQGTPALPSLAALGLPVPILSGAPFEVLLYHPTTLLLRAPSIPRQRCSFEMWRDKG